MIAFKFICIVSTFFIVTQSASLEKKEEPKYRQKRDGGISAALIGAAISAGASLVGTSVNALRRDTFSVAASGDVSNFASDTLILDFCKIQSGKMNEPPRDVSPGQREGFAGHKQPNTATGHWVQCRYRIGTEALIYFMYSVPYSHDFNSNLLAASICLRSSRKCRDTSINLMTTGTRGDLVRKTYYSTLETLKVCNIGYCVTGVMGTSHKPQINFKVYPVKFSELASAVQGSAAANRWNAKDYDNFVKNELA